MFPQPVSIKEELWRVLCLLLKSCRMYLWSAFSLELSNGAVNESPCFLGMFCSKSSGGVQQDDKQPLE